MKKKKKKSKVFKYTKFSYNFNIYGKTKRMGVLSVQNYVYVRVHSYLFLNVN